MMSKKRLFDEVANKTGESSALIRQRGFSPLRFGTDSLDAYEGNSRPRTVDWDALEQQRGIGLFPCGRS